MSHITQLLEVVRAYREYVGALPKDLALPAMPGFDRDWADTIEAKARAALAQPVPKASDKAAHELEVSLLLSTINMLTAKERDQHGENFGVVVGFTDKGLTLVDYPSEGNTISLEEGMILYPLAAGRAAQEAEK